MEKVLERLDHALSANIFP